MNSKLDLHRDDIIDVETISLEDAEIGIVAYGSSARSARRAMHLAREKGIRVGLFRPKVLWPFPDREVKQMADQVKKILVPEMNLGQISHEVEWAVNGKVEIHNVNRIDGEPINPIEILHKIEEIA